MSSPQDNKESPSNDDNTTTTTSASTSTSTTPDESIQLDKAELYRKIDMIYQREKDMAVKVAIDKMNVELAAVKKIQKEEITSLRDEMEKLRKSIETDDEVKAIEEATSKRNDEDDVEGMRVQMIREHQREKELLRETYEAKMVNAVEVALTKLRGEMQLLIDNEKEKATNLLRCLRDMQQQQQQQQQPRQGHHAPQFYATQGHSTQENAMQGRDPTTVDNGRGLELTTKKISDRSLDVDEETRDYESAPKRLKLVTAAAARPFDPLRRSAASEERLLLTTKEGETGPGDSVCLWKNNVIPHEKSVPSSMGISAHWQMRPHQEGQLEAVVRPTTLTNEAEMMIENVRSVTADMKSPSKEQPHRTAVEALLFAAEKMDESTPSARKKPKKKPKRIIDESIAIEPTENDVLFGRGGYINIHPGNVRFRTKAFELRTWYEASTKEEKYNISKRLIESVKGEGHRFLEKTSDGLWHEVSGNGVRKKASQALRERVRGPTNSSDSVGSEEGKMSHTKHTTIADPHIPI